MTKILLKSALVLALLGGSGFAAWHAHKAHAKNTDGPLFPPPQGPRAK